MQAETMLIGLDGSQPSQSAGFTGLWLARALNLDVHAVYIIEAAAVEDPYAVREQETPGGALARTPEDAVALGKESGQQVLEELQLAGQALDLDVVPEIVFGGVVPLLTRAAKESAIAVIGRRGRDHAADAGALGTNFEALLAGIAQPLLIGGDYQPRSLDRILLAYDASDSAEDALEWVCRLADALEGVHVDILAVEERGVDARQAEQWLQTAFQRFPQALEPPRVFMHHGEAGREILAAADEHQTDLIVMGRSRPMLPGLGRTLERILRGNAQPVFLP